MKRLFLNLLLTSLLTLSVTQASTNQASDFIDLEKEMMDDFVLETKKIEIPGYPDAFNPSIIRWNSSLLLSFRLGKSRDFNPEDQNQVLMSFRIRDPISGSTNGIGLVILDEDFNLKSSPQVLDIPHTNPEFALRQQDPRLVAIGERLFIVYSNMIEGSCLPEIRRMFFAELFYNGEEFYTGVPECIVKFDGESESRWQKNWVPFDYEGELYLAYSLVPHKILKPIVGTGSCETAASSLGLIKWKWGVLRGGTQALLDEGEYLSFFHSSIPLKSAHSEGKQITHYFMGAYTFSSKPPFEIKRISPKPIVGKDFYHGPAHKTWKPLRCVFPCGFVADNDYVWVAYGRQDHEVWVAKMDKKRLKESLVQIPEKIDIKNSSSAD